MIKLKEGIWTTHVWDAVWDHLGTHEAVPSVVLSHKHWQDDHYEAGLLVNQIELPSVFSYRIPLLLLKLLQETWDVSQTKSLPKNFLTSISS